MGAPAYTPGNSVEEREKEREGEEKREEVLETLNREPQIFPLYTLDNDCSFAVQLVGVASM